MPYRRLPNTDKARLYALQNAVQRAQSADYTEQVIPYKMLNEVQRFLVQFENMVMQSKDNYKTSVHANKQYRHIVQNARMYISHFIQVFNLAVIRGEIKKEQKLLYGLDPLNHVVPDLSTEKIFPGNIKVKALFTPDMKWRLVEEFGPDCYEVTEEGRLLFTADYTDLENLITWLLTFGEKVEVIEPKEIRERILKTVDAIYRVYGRTNK